MRVELAHEFRRRVVGLRLAGEDDDDFSLQIYAGKIVVSIFGSIDAITGKDNRTAYVRGTQALVCPPKIFAEGVTAIDAADFCRQGCVFAVQVAGNDIHLLEVSAMVSNRIQPKPHKL
jgi:hypothetical protein